VWEDASGVLGGELLAVFDAHGQLQTSLVAPVGELIERRQWPSRAAGIRKEVVPFA
jgi:hypothetical protein